MCCGISTLPFRVLGTTTLQGTAVILEQLCSDHLTVTSRRSCSLPRCHLALSLSVAPHPNPTHLFAAPFLPNSSFLPIFDTTSVPPHMVIKEHEDDVNRNRLCGAPGTYRTRVVQASSQLAMHFVWFPTEMKDVENSNLGTFLVVQWPGLHAPSAGARVQSLVGKNQILHATTKEFECHN